MQWYWIAVLSVFGLWFIYSLLTSFTMAHYSARPKKFTDEECNKREKDLIKFDSTNYDKLSRETFELNTDGALIKGYIIYNEKKSDKVAVIVHGFTASVISCAKYGEIFYNLGYNIVTFDQRYFGQSTGDSCTMGYRESGDLLEVIEFIKTKFVNPKIVLHGESMGAATVLLALPKTDNSIIYAVADCSFSRCKKLYRYVTRRTTLFLKVVGVVELNGIDEDAAHADIILRACTIQQREVPPVQGAHGGYKAYLQTLIPCILHGLTNLIFC